MRNSKNKKSRKLLTLLLAVAMTISMIPMNFAMAGILEYSSWDADNTTLTINNDSWFTTDGEKNAYMNEATKVILGDNVTIIDEEAFYDWEALTDIEIPNSVAKIGAYAFQECKALKTIEIPNSVTEIDEKTFSGCTKLKTVQIPNSVTKIGGFAFADCDVLTDIEIPNSVTEIGVHAFENCYALTDIEIPNSVTKIGGAAFYNCNNATNLVIPNGLETIEFSAFGALGSLTKVVIPSSVTTIGEAAFNKCKALKEIKIPRSVETIENDAFRETALTTVYVERNDTARVKSLLEGSGVTNTDELTFIEPEEPAKYHRHKNIDLTDQEKAEDERNAKKLGSFGFDTASKGEHAIRTRWIASDNADGYIIYRSTEKVGNYERISKITDERILEYRDENLEANTHYYYKVASYVANTIGTKKVYSKKYLKAKRYTTK